MNVFDLIVVLAFFGAGCLCGRWLGSLFGVWGWVVGIPLDLGLVAGILTGLRRLIDISYRWRPLRPTCKEGRCSSEDCRVVKSSEDGVIVACRCGTSYVRKGRRFMEILDDGASRPFKTRRDPLGRWTRDDTAVEGSDAQPRPADENEEGERT